MKVKDKFFEFFNTTKNIMIGGYRQTLKTSLMVEWIKYAYAKGLKICLIVPKHTDVTYIKKQLTGVKIDIFSSMDAMTGIRGRNFDMVFYDEPLFWDTSFSDVHLNIYPAGVLQYIMFSYRPVLTDNRFRTYEKIALNWPDDYVEIYLGMNNNIFFSGSTKKGSDSEMIWELRKTIKLDDNDEQKLSISENIFDKTSALPNIIIEKDEGIIL